MAINPGQVPIPGAPRPLQLPASRDASDIILHAAKLQQDERQMQQKAYESLSDVVMTTAKLAQAQRQKDIENAQADAMLQMKAKLQDSLMDPGAVSFTNVGGHPAAIARRATGPEVTFAPKDQAPPKLTPQQQKDNPDRLLTIQELQSYGKPAGTKLKDVMGQVPVSTTNRGQIAEAQNAFPQLDLMDKQLDALHLETSLGKRMLRGAEMLARSKDPSTPEGIYAGMAKNISIIVRSLGQKGVLTDDDVKRADGLIPGFFDSPKSKKQKIDQIRTIISGGLQNKKSSLVGDVLADSGAKEISDPNIVDESEFQ